LTQESDSFSVGHALRTALDVLASLKLTVVLFALAIFLILAGTLAQATMDIWDVIREYFRTPIAFIKFQVFFPPSFFPSKPQVPGGFWFPGGWLIGAGMMLNLAAAHLVRFKVGSGGVRLWSGVGVCLLGVLTTWAVVQSGSNPDGLQDEPLLNWATLWTIIKFSLGALWIGVATTLMRVKWERQLERWTLILFTLSMGVFVCWLIASGNDNQLSPSSMRILWQLIKGGFAGVVLLAGCYLVFNKRAGMVLIHAGVGLMMFSELFVGLQAIEEQTTIYERTGEKIRYAYDIRTTELAVSHQLDNETDRVTVIPQELLKLAESKSETLTHADLPFDVRVLRFDDNSTLRSRLPDDDEMGNQGWGERFVVDKTAKSPGADADNKADGAAAYVELIRKDDGTTMGSWMLSVDLSHRGYEEEIDVGGTKYTVALRSKRSYKPYSLELLDVRKDDYVGTNMVRNYSSDIRLVDPSRGVDREVHIWMNNPLRYAGETFYQQNYASIPVENVDPRSDRPRFEIVEATTLAIVTNQGWMIPYVSCMIVAVGMFWHFWLGLVRFLDRRAAGRITLGETFAGPDIDFLPGETTSTSRDSEGKALETTTRGEIGPSATSRRGSVSPDSIRKGRGKNRDRHIPAASARSEETSLGDAAHKTIPWHIVVPVAVVLVCGLWVASKFRPPSYSSDKMNLAEFGKLPIVYEGRNQPIDSYARNTLNMISERQTFIDQEGVGRLGAEGSREPAIRWLLDEFAKEKVATSHRVIKIDNLEVLDALKLKQREGWRYSFDEFAPALPDFAKLVTQAEARKEKNEMTAFDRKVLQTARRMMTRLSVERFFRPPPMVEMPSAKEFATNSDEANRVFGEILKQDQRFHTSIKNAQGPLAIPTLGTNEEGESVIEWKPYSASFAIARRAEELRSLQAELKKLGMPDQPLELPKTDPATVLWNQMIVAYAKNDVKTFNDTIGEYRKFLADNNVLTEKQASRVKLEWYFNQMEPFYYSLSLYLVAFLFTIVSWLVWPRTLSLTAFSLIVFTLLIHTAALWMRIKISGRPPVTNLYSSAIFIGWACVVLGLLMEVVFKLGIGNLIASISGASTLMIAHQLALDGDTIKVLQAVLDTQFWLATHVVTVTLGYATTFVAGFLGLTYVLRGALTKSLTNDIGKSLTRMTYGAICFSIFFSFVGTVLGGLWADDSWGRFWGWDPKENGALIIVLWNALVLHARWDGLVKDRGFAILAVGGNIATAWSWFGVNQLGIGLHSYGFTDGVMRALSLFVASQLLVIGIGMIPEKDWRSVKSASLGASRRS